MVMELLIPVAIALVLVVVAWKVLKGLVKTAALVGLVAVAAVYVSRRVRLMLPTRTASSPTSTASRTGA
jgi:hypothetical protein